MSLLSAILKVCVTTAAGAKKAWVSLGGRVEKCDSSGSCVYMEKESLDFLTLFAKQVSLGVTSLRGAAGVGRPVRRCTASRERR
jgi:hypothetical protein